MLVDPAGGTPVVLRLQVAQHAAALAVHERSGRLLATRAETAISNVKQKCPNWIKCRLTTYVHRVDLQRSFRPNTANLHLQRTLLFEEAGQKKPVTVAG